jgi:cytidylate kinase
MAVVITIDGPSGAGKGTVGRLLAKRLNFHYLDSGALYRLLGLAVERHKLNRNHHCNLAVLAENMDIAFEVVKDGEHRVLLEGEDVTRELRTEHTGALASRVAAYPEVREALLIRQTLFAKEPGLVADGRDMGTVVFPEAELKIYLTATIEERARRRYKQLLDMGENVSLRALEGQVRSRDKRDINRDTAPLVPATDAIQLDTSGLPPLHVLETVLDIAVARCLV